jgi:hypothetical protein
MEENLTKLTYVGNVPFKFFIINTRRTVLIEKVNQIISVDNVELEEIKKSRFKNSFKELKESKKEVKT